MKVIGFIALQVTKDVLNFFFKVLSNDDPYRNPACICLLQKNTLTADI